MKHHLSTWSKRLTAEARKRYDKKLRFLDKVLSAAGDATPRLLRQTELRHLADLADAKEKYETAMAALECASVCRDSYPDDFNALCAVMKVVIKGPLPVKDDELHRLLEFLAQSERLDPKIMPIDEALGQVERFVLGRPAQAEWQPLLETIHQRIESSASKRTKSVDRVLARIKRLSDDSVTAQVKPDDGWADRMHGELERMSDAGRKRWEALLRHATCVAPQAPVKAWDIGPREIRASIMNTEAYEREHARRFFARKASFQWAQEMNKHVAAVSTERFEALRLEWLQAVPDSKPGTLSQFSVNREILRGLLWTCAHSDDPDLARAIRIADEYFYRKNSPLARAALQILAHMPAPNTLEELTHLANRVKRQSQVQLIESARALIANRTGVPPGELSELPLPECGFGEMGRRVESLSGFTAELVLTASATPELRWFKPNGQRQKSIPAKVQREHAADVRNLKAAIKEVKSTLATARVQLELAALERRSWTIERWRKRYFDHPVVGTIGRRIVWQFEHAGKLAVGAFDGRSIVKVEGRPLKLSDAARASVWHPMGAPVEEVLRWREWLANHEVTQPFKQAYREIYLLTDAERATGTYSNRFAAHILKQSQFRALAKTRRWETAYLGPWDAGDHGTAQRELPAWRLRAELWTTGASDDAAPAGGFFYIATDQVRFYRAGSRDPLPLDDVPPIVFSEIMRDVDLFVGVASVGNDPTWYDGGPDGRYADYWLNYSFGELAEPAVTRRAALERIVPRLKIADRCTFSDRFLIVRGDIRTYRIHLGSGNILMEPNEKYLCIVPDRSAKRHSTLFLPFEGDDRLSVILSKALLLADDTSITDPTILSQIARD